MSALERAGVGVFAALAKRGSLALTLPDGSVEVLGSGEPSADLAVADYGVLAAVLRKGLLGFAEAYMQRRADTSDLPALLRWGVANRSAWFDHPVVVAGRPLRSLWQKVKPELRHDRVRTMNDHYNLGNDFYAAWLDESMTYSSARFAHPGQGLGDAQRNKYRSIADHARLQPGMRVLEIGCGWGGFAEYAAGTRGCEVVGVTVAEEHAAFASKRVADAGLGDRVDIRIQDFREIEGTFDAVVSIEMIESVDESRWPGLMDTIARSLSPGALAAMQIITIEDGEWERYRRNADFIQQYIFPGGQIPAPKVLRKLAAGADLAVEQVEAFGLDYARTLSMWRDRFEASWDRLRVDNDLDDRFYRMWQLYLGLCEAGFRMGRIDVQQWVFSPS